MTDVSPVGLIGVGLLGSALAERLMASGETIHAFDTDAAQLVACSALGGIAARDADEVIRGCDPVVLCLPTSQIVAELIARHREAVRPGQIVIDASTGDPAEMIAIGQALAQRGAHYVEALVAGSSQQMRTGNVALFVGGDPSPVARVTPLLEKLTSTHFHLGPAGTASRFKLVHNLLLGLNRAALAEALTFAESLGFAPELTLDVLRQTPAASGVMETKGTRMVRRDFSPQARLSQHLKDVRLMLAAAEETGCPLPLSAAHRQLLERAEAMGYGEADNSAIIEAIQPRS